MRWLGWLGRVRGLAGVALLATVWGGAAAVGVAAAATPKKHTAASHAKHAAAHGKAVAAAHGRRAGRATAGARGRAARARVVLRKHARKHPLTAHAAAQTRHIQQAFVASAELRPMAQQLGFYRSPAAYAGVTSYAHAHTGEAAAAAYLALGHAYLYDKHYPEALEALRQADAAGDALDDYATYFAAQADLQSGQLPAAIALLDGFNAKYPDSIWVNATPVLEANAYLQQTDPASALRVLRAHATEPLAAKPDYLLAMAKALQASGQAADANAMLERVVNEAPLANEATIAEGILTSGGQWQSLPLDQRRRHADTLFKNARWAAAATEFRALASDSRLADADRYALLVNAAHCDWKLKKLTQASLNGIPDLSDDTGAHRLYLLLELARNSNDTATVESLDQQMEARFAQSQWLSEALFSTGNMYMLRKDYPSAITFYTEEARRFARGEHGSPAHWRAAWLNYRLRNYAEAARLIDEQLTQFPDGKELPAALYWRGRIFADQEQKPAMAAEYYSTVARVYRHYYYAEIAKQRLASLGGVQPAAVPSLDAMQPEQIPTLTEDVPEDDPHLAKAKVLANAGLNDYLAQEIHAAEGSDSWGALAEARLYASYGENYRAMRALKRGIPFYTSASIEELPMPYWRILFPEPYWSTIKTEAARNGLDPYMVASLIRQESEFNPKVISYANAYGLMQLLPSVGREVAKQQGVSARLDADALLDPQINIKLGCVYLREMLDKFGGHQEYAFAAYNAGDYRVTDWQSAPGGYAGIDEFVESIPFTETREYVQAIMRNEDIYREMDQYAAANGESPAGTTAGGAQ